jgi:hypothetical protein
MGVFDDLEAHRVEGEPHPHPRPHPRKNRRHFTAFEDEWAHRLMTSEASRGVWALSFVLLRMAFFYDRFPVTSKAMARAGLGRTGKRNILEKLSALGLIEVTWRGARAPIVEPLHLQWTTQVLFYYCIFLDNQ